jgi:calcineurin-like phosphoesterase
MAMTLAEQLTNVQTAIAAIETGAQEITINNRTFRKADLKVLYDREEQLLRRVQRESAGGMRTLAEF